MARNLESTPANDIGGKPGGPVAVAVAINRMAVRTGHARDAAELLREIGLSDRWRPLFEALLVIAEGRSSNRLLRVAPEVRRPAEQLVKELQPSKQQTRKPRRQRAKRKKRQRR